METCSERPLLEPVVHSDLLHSIMCYFSNIRFHCTSPPEVSQVGVISFFRFPYQNSVCISHLSRPSACYFCYLFAVSKVVRSCRLYVKNALCFVTSCSFGGVTDVSEEPTAFIVEGLPRTSFLHHQSLRSNHVSDRNTYILCHVPFLLYDDVLLTKSVKWWVRFT